MYYQIDQHSSFGGLGSTYTIHLRRGLVALLNFSPAVTAEALRAKMI